MIEHLRGVIATRRYTNLRLPYLSWQWWRSDNDRVYEYTVYSYCIRPRTNARTYAARVHKNTVQKSHVILTIKTCDKHTEICNDVC